MVGNGHTLPITHIGETTLGIGSSSIHLKDVLLVLDIKKDLLSVSKLTTDYPLIFEFDGHGFVIKDRTPNKTVAKGSKRGGLYAFDRGPTALFSHRFKRVTRDCWHYCLGHAHQRIIDHLHSRNFISFASESKSSSICTSCQMGKSCRLPFLPKENEIKFTFYKIHCDLWGLAPVFSRENYRYYIIFVDEFTNFNWFFPTKRSQNFLIALIYSINMWDVNLMQKFVSFKVMKVETLQIMISCYF